MNVSGEMSHEVYSKDEAMQIKMSDQLFSKRRVVVEQGRVTTDEERVERGG